MVAPLATACSSSSRTTTPAPSPITKPSRPVSHGREAISGVSLYLPDNALAAANPAIPNLHTAASAPPATMMSASSSAIILAASPMA